MNLCPMLASTQLSASNAFAPRGSWQAKTASPCRLPQANDKTPRRPVYALQKPFAGASLERWLDDPLGSWGQYSSRHGSCTSRWSEPWLGRGCQWFGHRLRIWSSVSLLPLWEPFGHRLSNQEALSSPVFLPSCRPLRPCSVQRTGHLAANVTWLIQPSNPWLTMYSTIWEL